MAAVLKPRKGFEDILRSRGFAIQVPNRPYTALADDIRLRQNYTFNLEEARLIQAQVIQRRAYWDSVRMAAAAQGVPLHQEAMNNGFHVRPEREPVVGNHNEGRRREEDAREAEAARLAEEERRKAALPDCKACRGRHVAHTCGKQKARGRKKKKKQKRK